MKMLFHEWHQHTGINMHNIFAAAQRTETDECDFEGTVERNPHLIKELGDERACGTIAQTNSLHLMQAKHKVTDSPGNIVMIWSVPFKLAQFDLVDHSMDFSECGGHRAWKRLLRGIVLDKLGELTPSSIEIH
jgi:hypothetical protein